MTRRARLRSALVSGAFVPQLDIESSPNPLRARPDFRLLMRDVEFPIDPFAR